MRFLASFAVVVLHVSFYTSERLNPSFGVYQIGSNGVRLFFVISGFVMIVSSEKLVDRTRGWAVFGLRRIIRIVPVYWAMIALKVATLLILPAVALHSRLDWGFVLKSMFFYPAYNVEGEIRPIVGVGWTLSFEMLFYLMFAVALLVRARPILFLAPILIGMSILSIFKTTAWPLPLYFWCSPILLDFLCGMMIARWAQTHRALPPALGWFMIVAGLAYLFVPFPRAYDATLIGSLITTCAASAVIIACISLEPRIGHKIPKVVLLLGAASYSTYLVHPMTAPIVPQLLARIGLRSVPLSMIGGIIVALVAGLLTYRFLENFLTKRIERAMRSRGLLDPGAPVGKTVSAA